MDQNYYSTNDYEKEDKEFTNPSIQRFSIEEYHDLSAVTVYDSYTLEEKTPRYCSYMVYLKMPKMNSLDIEDKKNEEQQQQQQVDILTNKSIEESFSDEYDEGSPNYRLSAHTPDSSQSSPVSLSSIDEEEDQQPRIIQPLQYLDFKPIKITITPKDFRLNYRHEPYERCYKRHKSKRLAKLINEALSDQTPIQPNESAICICLNLLRSSASKNQNSETKGIIPNNGSKDFFS